MSSIIGRIAAFLRIQVDDSEVESLQDKIDQQATAWQAERTRILSEMRDIGRGIGLLFTGIRLAVRLAGQALTPIQTGVMSIISGMVSLMLATATAMAAGSVGLLTGVALALASVALGISIGETAKQVAIFAEAREGISRAQRKLADSQITIFGGGGL